MGMRKQYLYLPDVFLNPAYMEHLDPVLDEQIIDHSLQARRHHGSLVHTAPLHVSPVCCTPDTWLSIFSWMPAGLELTTL